MSKNITINVQKEDNLKSLKLIEVGCKAKLLFSRNTITDEEETKFRKKCLSFYQTAVEKLQFKLPLDVNFLKDAQYINPIKRNDAGATSAISNIALKITSTLGNVLGQVFQVDALTTKDQLIDKIRTQWHFFQNADFREDWYLKPSPEDSTTLGKWRQQDS